MFDKLSGMVSAGIVGATELAKGAGTMATGAIDAAMDAADNAKNAVTSHTEAVNKLKEIDSLCQEFKAIHPETVDMANAILAIIHETK